MTDDEALQVDRGLMQRLHELSASGVLSDDDTAWLQRVERILVRGGGLGHTIESQNITGTLSRQRHLERLVILPSADREKGLQLLEHYGASPL